MQKKLVAIFDLDDTLSDTAHRRHLLEPEPGLKKDWDAFFDLSHLDESRPWMVTHALELSRMGVEIVIFTGRPERVRDTSMKWLAELGIEPKLARFRRFKDFQKTAKMKGNWLAELSSQEGVEIICAVDDEATNLAAFSAAGICAIDATQIELAQTLFVQVKSRLALHAKTESKPPMTQDISIQRSMGHGRG